MSKNVENYNILWINKLLEKLSRLMLITVNFKHYYQHRKLIFSIKQICIIYDFISMQVYIINISTGYNNNNK